MPLPPVAGQGDRGARQRQPRECGPSARPEPRLVRSGDLPRRRTGRVVPHRAAGGDLAACGVQADPADRRRAGLEHHLRRGPLGSSPAGRHLAPDRGRCLVRRLPRRSRRRVLPRRPVRPDGSDDGLRRHPGDVRGLRLRGRRPDGRGGQQDAATGHAPDAGLSPGPTELHGQRDNHVRGNGERLLGRQAMHTTIRGSATIVATVLALGLGTAGAPGAAPPGSLTQVRSDEAPQVEGAPLRTAAVQRLVERLSRVGVVGVSVEIRRGRTTWAKAGGSAQVDPRQPAALDARFRAGSVAKQLVSVLALQLVEAGTWSLDSTLGELAPGLWPGQEAVTVRQLLSHTSGLPDYLTPMVSEAAKPRAFLDAIDDRWRDPELIAIAQQLPATSTPGTFSYSNTNYIVLGELLKRATGRSVAVLAERRILRRAGMSDTYFAEDRRFPAPRLSEYARFPVACCSTSAASTRRCSPRPDHWSRQRPTSTTSTRHSSPAPSSDGATCASCSVRWLRSRRTAWVPTPSRTPVAGRASTGTTAAPGGR